MGDDDDLPNKRDGTAGVDNDDDFDEKNIFAALMNQAIPVAESRFTQEELSKIRKEFDKLSKD